MFRVLPVWLMKFNPMSNWYRAKFAKTTKCVRLHRWRTINWGCWVRLLWLDLMTSQLSLCPVSNLKYLILSNKNVIIHKTSCYEISRWNKLLNGYDIYVFPRQSTIKRWRHNGFPGQPQRKSSSSSNSSSFIQKISEQIHRKQLFIVNRDQKYKQWITLQLGKYTHEYIYTNEYIKKSHKQRHHAWWIDWIIFKFEICFKYSIIKTV